MKKKKYLLTILGLIFLCLVSGCKLENDQKTQNENHSEQIESVEKSESEASDAGHTLVAYFSATGNTRLIAKYTAEILDADLYEIIPENIYTEEDLNYNDPSSRATQEQNDPLARPAISNSIEDIEQYDTVLIAYPIWWGKEPKIIDTFIESYDLSGKTITALCTSGGSEIAVSAANLQSEVPDARWLEGKRFEIGTTQSEVEKWLSEIGLIE